jgi:hypothetical protein
MDLRTWAAGLSFALLATACGSSSPSSSTSASGDAGQGGAAQGGAAQGGAGQGGAGDGGAGGAGQTGGSCAKCAEISSEPLQDHAKVCADSEDELDKLSACGCDKCSTDCECYSSGGGLKWKLVSMACTDCMGTSCAAETTACDAN